MTVRLQFGEAGAAGRTLSSNLQAGFNEATP
jgi:hypothetical protein